MKKFNLFTLLVSLGLFGSYITDGEGGGSSGDGENGGDNNSGSENKGGENNNDSGSRDKELDDNNLDDKKKESSSDDGLDVQAELKILREDKQNRDKKDAHNNAVASVKKLYPDFDGEKIKNKLQEMEDKEAGSSDRYNNPAGWEALHLRYFQTKEVDNDDIDLGRKEQEKFDFNDAMEKATKGDDASIEALLNNSISTNQ